MKKFNLRDWFGIGLVLLGVLMLLENIGFLRGATDILMSAVLLLVASYFFGNYARNPRGGWWNIIPAMALLGMASENLLPLVLPRSLGFIAGNAFLLCMGAAFFLVYLGDRARWWGIIPGGVLLTLAAINMAKGGDNPGMLLLGLGVTFVLVGLLPAANGRNEWAYIPGITLLLLGRFLLAGEMRSMLNAALPYGLILLGLVVLLRFWFGRKA